MCVCARLERDCSFAVHLAILSARKKQIAKIERYSRNIVASPRCQTIQFQYRIPDLPRRVVVMMLKHPRAIYYWATKSGETIQCALAWAEKPTFSHSDYAPSLVRLCVFVKDVGRALVHIKTHLLFAVRFYALKYTFADYIVLNSESTTLHNAYLQYINFKTWIIQRNHSATAEHTSAALLQSQSYAPCPSNKYYAKWLCGFNRTHQNNYNFPVVCNMCPVCACARVRARATSLCVCVSESVSVWVSLFLRKQFSANCYYCHI